MIDCLDKAVDTEDTIDIFPYIKRCALDIICGTAMGIKIDAQIVHDHQYVQAVEGFNRLAVSKDRTINVPFAFRLNTQ